MKILLSKRTKELYKVLYTDTTGKYFYSSKIKTGNSSWHKYFKDLDIQAEIIDYTKLEWILSINDTDMKDNRYTIIKVL